jgi:hypothetical protein
LPASPARAASIVALSASRLVWPAMSLISLSTSPIFCAASARPRIVWLVRSASLTARPAICAEDDAWRPISPIEALSSSAAEATVWTLTVACSDAAATAPAWREVSSAVADSDCAEDCMSPAAEATPSTTPPTDSSKPSAILSIAARFSASARSRSAAPSTSSALARVKPSRNTASARAMAPTSSLRASAGMSRSSSPAAIACIEPVIDEIGRAIERPISQPISTPSASTPPTAASTAWLVHAMLEAAACSARPESASKALRMVSIADAIAAPLRAKLAASSARRSVRVLVSAAWSRNWVIACIACSTRWVCASSLTKSCALSISRSAVSSASIAAAWAWASPIAR